MDVHNQQRQKWRPNWWDYPYQIFFWFYTHDDDDFSYLSRHRGNPNPSLLPFRLPLWWLQCCWCNRKLDEASESLIRHKSDLTHPIWTNILLWSNESCLLCTIKRKSTKYQKSHYTLKVLGLSHAFDPQIKTCQNTCILLTLRIKIDRRRATNLFGRDWHVF